MEGFLERIISRERDNICKSENTLIVRRRKEERLLLNTVTDSSVPPPSLSLSLRDAKQSAVVICTSKHRVKNLKGCAFNSSGASGRMNFVRGRSQV